MTGRNTLLAAACAAMFINVSAHAQYSVRMTADNYFAGYTGSGTAVTTKHFTGSWSAGVYAGTFNSAATYLYIVAWDDGGVLQGLIGSIASGNGIVPTGSPFWTVCATNQPLSNTVNAAPTAAALSTQIAACNAGNRWHATTVGPNNVNASSSTTPSGQTLWGRLNNVEPTANWIWDTNRSRACAGTNGFLEGLCNPGEYLIFRLALARVAACLPPVPDFSMNWTSGPGKVIADGTNSQNELNYFWSVQESNASWTGIGPEITQWFTGQAGPFDIRTFFEAGAKTPMKCDAYYRVKLAVGNHCINWRSSTRLIRLKCCPGEVSAPVND
jgi:hypothetical protein